MKKRGNTKKGVSPLIATVLLIGFVVALSVLIWFWYNNFLQGQSEKLGTKSVGEGICSIEIDYNIRDTSCYQDPQANNKSIIFTVENTGTANIADFRVILFGDIADLSTEISEALPKTASKQLSVEYDPSEYGAIETLRIMPIILTDGTKTTCTDQTSEIEVNCA